MFFLCVRCHLPTHISLNQLRYLSGFTRSLQMKLENLKCHRSFPHLTTLPLENTKYRDLVSLSVAAALTTRTDPDPRAKGVIQEPDSQCVVADPGSSTSHPFLSIALASETGTSDEPPTVTPFPLCCASVAVCGAMVTEAENGTGLE